MPDGTTSALAAWWDHADRYFSHIRYGYFLGNEAHMIDLWRKAWLDRLCTLIACPTSRFLEYGIGGGLLGQYLLESGRGFGVARFQLDGRAVGLARSAEIAHLLARLALVEA